MLSGVPISAPSTRTKIVATLGPSSADSKTIRSLVQAGLSVARLNFAHGTTAQHRELIRLVRESSVAEERHVAILGDLMGPRIRVGAMVDHTVVAAGSTLHFDRVNSDPGDRDRVGLSHFDSVAGAVTAGHRILVDDGTLRFKVVASSPETIEVIVEVGGEIGAHKGVNLPDSILELEAVTDRDRADLEFSIHEGIDYLGLSFVRNAASVRLLKSEIEQRGGAIPVIAKIERKSAVEDIDAIVDVADGIMVARGDLALEVGAALVPLIQKRLIARANRAGIPVITATQMLDSMIRNPTPTRAETSDVANAILDGTDAVMLSGETAIGRFPVESLREMVVIGVEAETGLRFGKPPHGEDRNVSAAATAIGAAAVDIATRLKVAAVVAATTTGSTARIAARFRPEMPLVGVTRDPAVCRRMALIWGVLPALVESYDSTETMTRRAATALVDLRLATTGDRFVVISGQPIGRPGSTNMVQIRRVGDDAS